jgi:holo-[acyl-carrier protein] synthase
VTAMHLVAHGLDLVACKRIEQALREHGDRLLDRLLTDTEKRYVAGKRDPVPHLAGRFAAKEAVFKAIGTGWRGGICWTDVEILNDAAGQPTCKLTGQVARVAAKLGIERMLISITHTDDFAAATALALGPAESR